MKVEFQKSQETTATVVQARILNFDNAGSLKNHQKNTTPTTVASLWGTTMYNRVSIINDLNEPFNTPRKLDSSNFLNSNTINTNYTNIDAGISLNMAKELQ